MNRTQSQITPTATVVQTSMIHPASSPTPSNRSLKIASVNWGETARTQKAQREREIALRKSGRYLGGLRMLKRKPSTTRSEVSASRLSAERRIGIASTDDMAHCSIDTTIVGT